MAIYQGYDVLDAMPNRRDDPTDTIDRSMSLLDPGIGKVAGYDHGATPGGVHTFAWFMANRTDADVFRAFITARKGKAVPCWVPTWRPDLLLTNGLSPTDVSFTITAVDYSKFMYPYTGRRYLAFLLNGGATQVYRKIIGAVDNGNGTETVTIDSAPGVTIPVDTMVSFLLLCRLTDDTAEIQWASRLSAEANLSFTELPLEVP